MHLIIIFHVSNFYRSCSSIEMIMFSNECYHLCSRCWSCTRYTKSVRILPSPFREIFNGIFRRFTPEQLGMHASWILIWNIIENCCLCLIFFLLNIQSQLRTLDLIAYCGYKYVGMIAALSCYLFTHSIWIYRLALLYSSTSISYFLVSCVHSRSFN